MTIFLMILQILISIAIILVVILQSGSSAGLSGSIAGGAETFFGGKKKGMDEFLGKVTVILTVVFFALTLLIAFLAKA